MRFIGVLLLFTAFAFISGRKGRSKCTARPERGPCHHKLFRYYFDSKVGRCKIFVYGGCEGNKNNYKTYFKCVRTCILESPRRMCFMVRDRGSCGKRILRYFFDVESGRCNPFFYTGCGGNLNNFHSRDECSYLCRGD